MSAAIHLALIVSALSVVFASGCQRGAGPSVLLVTLDTTRADHLSCYGYERKTSPNLDRFARESVRFTRAWSTSSWTLPAHASLFAGLYPPSHGAHFDVAGTAVLGEVVGGKAAQLVRAGRLPDRRSTLAELLAGSGYRTAAFVAGPWLHRGFGLLQGFETIDDEVSSIEGRRASEVTDGAIRWLAEMDSGQRVFLFVNYFDPHSPYGAPAGGEAFPAAAAEFRAEPLFDELLAGTRELTVREREILIDRYDGEIRYMDLHLGRLLDSFLARANDGGALVIVTGDHGEEFGEGGRYQHGHWLSDNLLRIPLLVRYPDRRRAGSVDASIVQLVDILPLVAHETGLDLPPSVQGMLPGRRELAFADLYRDPLASSRYGDRYDRALESVVEWPFQLVRSDRGEHVLHRLGRDGPQLESPGNPDRLERLTAILDERRQDLHRVKIETPAQVDRELREALRELGYIE